MEHVVSLRRHGEIAVIMIDNPPVNALGQAVRRGLWDSVEAGEADGDIQAIVLLGAGRAFIAGADIKEFGKPPLEPWLPDLCTRIEACSKPVIASLHGVSLGGGLEIALGAHYRVAVEDAKVGLPEVHLGLMPGAGGTQRLPRLTGAQAAVDMITSGRQVGAKEAETLGLIDKIAGGTPLENGLAFAAELLQQGKGRRAVSEMQAQDPLDWEAAHSAALAKGRGQVAPAKAIRAIEAAYTMPFAQGMKFERQCFFELMQTDQRQGMIHAFFSERAVSNLPELKGVPVRDVTHVAVIGGGTMGAGIATAALLSGLEVTLLEMSAQACEAARARIEGNLQGALKRGKISAEQFEKLTQKTLNLTTAYDDLAQVDLVVEAVFEDMAVKKQVFQQLDAVCKPGAILASNTSYLDVNEIAASTKRPGDVIGLHFFSPAHVMKLLEIVVPDAASPDVVATGFALGKRLKKISVRSGVCDGFIGNRILASYRMAADHMVLDGASPYEIDAAMTEFGFAMGPFAVGDLAGLDIGYAVRARKRAEGLPEGTRMSRYADQMVEAGWKGQKTGLGYYDYSAGKQASVPNPGVMPLIEAERAELGIQPQDFSRQEITRRYMAAMVNEAAKVVGKGIARAPRDVDMVLLFGYGFPRHWGGPLKWADLQGLSGLLDDIKTYAASDPVFWSVAPLLEQLVAEGRSFEDLNKGK